MDAIYRFFSRLSIKCSQQVLGRAGLSLPDIGGLGPRKRTTSIVQLVFDESDEARQRLEAIAGHVLALAEKVEHAESALRAACCDRADLLDLLESEVSLEERILNVWLQEPTLLDRARNLARTYEWREGRRYHAGFKVANPQSMSADLSDTVEAIRRLIQARQGGRNVDAEQFTYPGSNQGQTDASVGSGPVHHIALYLEAPARMLMEFGTGSSGAAPVVRREAREMAVEYDPGSGALSVAGRGVGGGKVFREVAEEFRRRALANAELTKLQHNEWPLEAFLSAETPVIQPPPGFSDVRVTGIMLRSKREDGGHATFHAGGAASAYDRMRELGIRPERLAEDWASSVTLTLLTIPKPDDDHEREVRVTLSWPNRLSFDGAGVWDRREIEAWLGGPSFTALGQKPAQDFTHSRVEIVRRPCRFGGTRASFRCPCCERTVLRLAVLPEGLRCGPCGRVTWKSRRLGPLQRQIQKAEKVAAKLGCDSWSDRLVQRSIYMRVATYERLRAEHATMVARINQQLAARMARKGLVGQLGLLARLGV